MVALVLRFGAGKVQVFALAGRVLAFASVVEGEPVLVELVVCIQLL